MVPILKMTCFSRLLRLLLPPEMGEMAQTFISEIQWLAVLKCRATGCVQQGQNIAKINSFLCR